MSFYIFAWIASFTYGLEVIFTKLTSKYGISNPWAFNFFWNVVLCLMMLPIALLNGLTFPSTWSNIVLAGFSVSVFSAIYMYCLFKLDVSVASPLFNFRTIFALFFGVLLLHEVIQTWQYPLILILLISGFFVTYSEKFSLKSFFNKNVLTLIFAMAALAIYSVFINRAVSEVGFWNATFWNTTLVPIFLLPTIPLFKNDLKKIRSKQIGALFIISLAGTIGTITSNLAYAKNVGLSSIILSIPFSMLMAIVLAGIWPTLLEKHTKKVYFVRLISAAIMIFCALKLSS